MPRPAGIVQRPCMPLGSVCVQTSSACRAQLLFCWPTNPPSPLTPTFGALGFSRDSGDRVRPRCRSCKAAGGVAAVFWKGPETKGSMDQWVFLLVVVKNKEGQSVRLLPPLQNASTCSAAYISQNREPEELPGFATPDPAHQRSTEEQHMRLGIVDFLVGRMLASLTEFLVRCRGGGEGS